MINFKEIEDGVLVSTGPSYVRIEPDSQLIDVDGSFPFVELEQILETAKAAVSGSEQPQSTAATDTPLPGFVSLG